MTFTWSAIMAWSGPALDLAILSLLVLVLLRLRQDPTESWREYEAKLREHRESLRLLIAQAEGEARELDKKLAAYTEQLRALSGKPETRSGVKVQLGDPQPRERDIVERVRQLAAENASVDEIARRLSLPVAEARLLMALSAAGQRQDAGKLREGKRHPAGAPGTPAQ